MPKKIDPHPQIAGIEKLEVFSELVLGTSQILRNHVNENQLAEWLEEVVSEKLGSLIGEDPPIFSKATRESLCRLWVAKVARGHMVRKGECEKTSLSEKDLALGPEWLRRAAVGVSGFTQLLMTNREREELCSILDWLRSDQGPTLASDWTKVSWPQALEAENLWIDEMGKAAAKKDMEAADGLGTEFFCEATGPDGSAGWRWVRVRSADSLDREGSMMKHCVGSYAKDVAEGRKEIYSLRDGVNKPYLTIEKAGAELCQLKAFANQPCPKEFRGCVGEFLSVFTQSLAGGVETGLSRDFESAGYEVVPGLGVVDKDFGLSKDQNAAVAFWVKDAESGGNDAISNLGKAFPFFAEIGCVEAVKVYLELGKPASGELGKGLQKASRNGHLEVVKLLLPVSDPKARGSGALMEACRNGNLEVVKLLLHVSDPKASNSWALAEACNHGHLEVVKLLLPVSDPKANDSQALGLACNHGHLEVVKLLLPVSDPKASNYQALVWACNHGHLEVVKLLLPVSDHKANDYRALVNACGNGHLEIVKLLLLVSDPKACESQALRLACQNGHLEVVKLLLPVSDPQDFDRAKTWVGGKDRDAILELLAASKNNGINQTELYDKDSFNGKLSERREKLNPASGKAYTQAP